MVRKVLAIAAALLMSLALSAKAADSPEQQSTNAQKLLATLNQVGINSKEVTDFVTETDSRIDKKGTMPLAEEDIMGGKLSFRYDVKALPSGRQFELRYTPDDSHVNVVARTNILQVSYHLEF